MTILGKYFICSFQNSCDCIQYLGLDFTFLIFAFFIWMMNYNVGLPILFFCLQSVFVLNLVFSIAFAIASSISHQFIYSAKTKRFAIWGQILLNQFQICKNEAKATFVSSGRCLCWMIILSCFWKRRAGNLNFSSLHRINFGPYHNH